MKISGGGQQQSQTGSIYDLCPCIQQHKRKEELAVRIRLVFTWRQDPRASKKKNQEIGSNISNQAVDFFG
jgi:hypothetical protein